MSSDSSDGFHFDSEVGDGEVDLRQNIEKMLLDSTAARQATGNPELQYSVPSTVFLNNQSFDEEHSSTDVRGSLTDHIRSSESLKVKA